MCLSFHLGALQSTFPVYCREQSCDNFKIEKKKIAINIILLIFL